MSADPRSRAQRRRDTEHRLTHDKDVWVASASADGAPYLVPLSFDWDGEALLMATPTNGPTGRNLAATRAVRLGLGHTRDVSMIEGDHKRRGPGGSERNLENARPSSRLKLEKAEGVPMRIDEPSREREADIGDAIDGVEVG